MPRRKRNTPVAVLTGDWHVRGDVPVCRTDDYVAAQWAKVEELLLLASQEGCPVLVAGDMFHKWNTPLWVVGELAGLILSSGVEVLAIAGNHDLPQHNLQQLPRSALGLLLAAQVVHDATQRQWINGWGIGAAHFDEKPVQGEYGGPSLLMLHRLVWVKQLHPEAGGCPASKVLRENPGWQVVLTGDNHQTFKYTVGGRTLVNPGSLMRMTADQETHRPCVYLLFNDGRLEPHYLEVDQGVVSREHLVTQESAQQSRERLAAYVERVRGHVELDLSFQANVVQYMDERRTPRRVRSYVMEALEDGTE